MTNVPDNDLEWLSLWQWLAVQRTKRRSLRRHHRERLQKSRAHYWGMGNILWGDMDEKQKGVVADTPTPCSCWMCGNPRKYNGEITRQEKKIILNTLGDDDAL